MAEDQPDLENISGIPCVHGVAAAVPHVLWDAWPEDCVKTRRAAAERAGLPLEVVSLPLGRADWERCAENCAENVARIADEGVNCVCYGFSVGAEDCRDELWGGLEIFLGEVIPAAAERGVNMAMYAGDGTDAFASEEDVDKFLALRPEREHGLAIRGGVGMPARNRCRKMARKYGAMGRVHFVELMNAAILEDIFFVEGARGELCAPVGTAPIVKALHDADFDGYVCPGGPGALRDIALGATYLSGIWESLEAFGY